MAGKAKDACSNVLASKQVNFKNLLLLKLRPNKGTFTNATRPKIKKTVSFQSVKESQIHTSNFSLKSEVSQEKICCACNMPAKIGWIESPP